MKNPQHRPRAHRSRGEMISTFCFVLVGLFFAGEARVLWHEGAQLKGGAMGLCAVLCVAAGLRVHIHNLWLKLAGYRK